MERQQSWTKGKAKESPRGGEKKTNTQQVRNKPSQPSQKTERTPRQQPVYTPKRISKGAPVFKQLHIKFRYSDAVHSYAHKLIAQVGSNPQVRVPPAPPAAPDALPVEVHHPEKLDFERVFTKIVPVKVDNGRLCITPKPGLGEGQRTQFVFSVLSHHPDEGGTGPLSPGPARAESCPPPKNLPTPPRPLPAPGQSGLLQAQAGNMDKKVCFCLPSIGQEPTEQSVAIKERHDVAGLDTETRFTQKISDSDLVPSRTRHPVSKVTRVRLKVKLPPISTKAKALPALDLPPPGAQAVT